jgi:DNA-binding MarR family transcriptional regulator
VRAAFPHAPTGQLNTSHLSAEALARLPPAAHAAFLHAYAGALDKAFKVAGFVSVAAFVASWFIQEKPMRTTVTAEDLGGSFAMPRGDDSRAEIIRALGVLVGRERMRAYFQRVAVEAGIDLPVTQCWVLVQVRRGCDDPVALAARSGVADGVVRSALADLAQQGLITMGNGADQPVQLTESGTAVADRLLTHIRDRLEKLLDGWTPDRYPDLARLLNEFATEVVPPTQPAQALTA